MSAPGPAAPRRCQWCVSIHHSEQPPLIACHLNRCVTLWIDLGKVDDDLGRERRGDGPNTDGRLALPARIAPSRAGTAGIPVGTDVLFEKELPIRPLQHRRQQLDVERRRRSAAPMSAPAFRSAPTSCVSHAHCGVERQPQRRFYRRRRDDTGAISSCANVVVAPSRSPTIHCPAVK